MFVVLLVSPETFSVHHVVFDRTDGFGLDHLLWLFVNLLFLVGSELFAVYDSFFVQVHAASQAILYAGSFCFVLSVSIAEIIFFWFDGKDIFKGWVRLLHLFPVDDHVAHPLLLRLDLVQAAHIHEHVVRQVYQQLLDDFLCV